MLSLRKLMDKYTLAAAISTVLSAPLPAYAIESGRFSTEDPHPEEAERAEPARVAATPRASSRTSPERESLRRRVEQLERADAGYVTELASLRQTLERAREDDVEIFTGMDDLLTRLEGYEALQGRVTRMENTASDQSLQYLSPIVDRGLEQLRRRRQEMTTACTRAYGTQLELARREVQVAEERIDTAARIEALDQNQQLDARARVQRAVSLRQSVNQQESASALQEWERRAQRAAELCDEATTAYQTLEQRLPRLVQENMFTDPRLRLEVGAQVGHRGALTGAATAAVSYRGDYATVGVGVGAGYGGTSVSTASLDRPATAEQQGEYVQVTSQTGREEVTRRYRGHLQLRLAAPEQDLSRRFTWTLGGVVDLVVSDQTVASERTRNVTFYSGSEQVGEGHAATAADAERSTHYGVVPGLAVDLWHDENRGGRALGARATAGRNITDDQWEATLGVVGRF